MRARNNRGSVCDVVWWLHATSGTQVFGGKIPGNPEVGIFSAIPIPEKLHNNSREIAEKSGILSSHPTFLVLLAAFAEPLAFVSTGLFTPAIVSRRARTFSRGQRKSWLLASRHNDSCEGAAAKRRKRQKPLFACP